MAEENKEVKPAETVAPEVASAKKEAAPVQVKRERPTNCAQCKKVIKNIRWYYRNGSAYCTKRCWKTATAKKEEKPAEPAA